MIPSAKVKSDQNKYWKFYSRIIMIIYLPFGILLCILAIFQVAGLFLTIVGIPVAAVVAKSLGTYLNPVGKMCVSSYVSEELNKREKLEKYGLNS